MNILGYDYKLEMEPDLEPMGRVRVGSLHIQISDKICPQQQVSTVLHEILEAVNSHLELGLNHQAIMCLETALYQTLTAAKVDLTPLLKEISESD